MFLNSPFSNTFQADFQKAHPALFLPQDFLFAIQLTDDSHYNYVKVVDNSIILTKDLEKEIKTFIESTRDLRALYPIPLYPIFLEITVISCLFSFTIFNFIF